MNPTIRYSTLFGVNAFLLFWVLFAFVSVLLTSVDPRLYIAVIFLNLYLLAYLFPWRIDVRFLFVGLTLFMAYKIYFLMAMDPVFYLDAERYFQQISSFASLDTFWDHAVRDVQELGIFSASSYTIFGFFYMPFYFLFGSESPHFIAIFNALLLIGAYLAWTKIVKERLPFLSLHLVGFVTLLLFLSPSLSYWSSMFMKDIISLATVVFALYFWHRQRWVLFAAALVVAIAVRPYAIAILFCYYVYLYRRTWMAWGGALGSLAIVAVTAGTNGVINTFANLRYVFLSPNPLDPSNWQVFTLPSLEGFIILGCLAIIAYGYFCSKASRPWVHLFALSTIIFSCVLTLVGFQASNSYGLLEAGDNFFRKRTPILFLIYTATIVAIYHIRHHRSLRLVWKRRAH